MTVSPSLTDTALLSTPEPCNVTRDQNAPSNTDAQTAHNDTRSIAPARQMTLPDDSSAAPPIGNLSKITPVRPERLAYHLHLTDYPTHLTSYLVQGFQKGFHLRHEGDIYNTRPNNSKAANKYSDIIEKNLQEELAANRIAGPFKNPPYDPFQVSPLNIREKKPPNKYRLIHDLSYPYDTTSINSNIPRSEASVQYASIRDAIQHLQRLPSGAYMCKTDIANAYKIVPVHPSDYPKLGLKFKGHYYYQLTLPQGFASSCAIFETLSIALQAIVEKHAPGVTVVHMIDYFLFIGTDKASCTLHLDIFQSLCQDIGIPLAPDKTTTPDTSTIFLGILLDSKKRLAQVPEDKVHIYSADIAEHIQNGRLTQKQLQSLVGKLNFASSVVPARAFLRRLIDKVFSVKKPHQTITLSQETLQDLRTW